MPPRADSPLRSSRRRTGATGVSSGTAGVISGGQGDWEIALRQRDPEEALHMWRAMDERYYLTKNAPHLVTTTPMLCLSATPVEKLHAYVFFKFLDVVALWRTMGWSRLVSASEVKERAPYVNRRTLHGGVEFVEATVNDQRLCTSLAMTAHAHGAVLLNHAEAVDVRERYDGVVVSVQDTTVRKSRWRRFLGAREGPDAVTEIRAKSVVNCTGHQVDAVAKLADPTHENHFREVENILSITLPRSVLRNHGLLMPRTQEGRTLSLFPTPEGVQMVGAESREFFFHMLSYVHAGRTTEESLKPISVWSTPRGYLEERDAEIAALRKRHHLAHTTPRVFTLLGGTLSSYRRTAECVVDEVLASAAFQQPDGVAHPSSRTRRVRLVGGWDVPTVDNVRRVYRERSAGAEVDPAVAEVLRGRYGNRVFDVLAMGTRPLFVGDGVRQATVLLDGEVRWALEREGAVTTDDVLRRFHLQEARNPEVCAVVRGVVDEIVKSYRSV
eukprot:PhM_4_TR13078/c0_g1_i1/m.74898/K00111/glpA, glpD; glycerol-3-phosphate dehydrogenase